jgi:hypothetical protein
MIATAAHSANQQPRASAKTRQRRAWSPDDRDHLVYQWVKFDGHKQSWVAQQLNINQTTVSRIVQRYERWQAHAQPGADGRLDPAEQLRAQRWLTYQRNEIILASALRIAAEMEGFVDVSKSTIHRPLTTNQESDIRTVHATVDRTGGAARFLRLAFRINMEQLKLVEKEPLAPLAPLTADDFDDETQRAIAAEVSDSPLRAPDSSLRVAEVEDDSTAGQAPATPPEDSVAPATGEGSSPPLKVHNLHIDAAAETDAKPELASSSVPPPVAEKNADATCIAPASEQRQAVPSPPPAAVPSIPIAVLHPGEASAQSPVVAAAGAFQ